MGIYAGDGRYFSNKEKIKTGPCFCFPSSSALIKYIRPVFVSRSDQDSRRKTVEEIKRRAQSDGKWPQVLYSATLQEMLFGISRLGICSLLSSLWVALDGLGSCVCVKFPPPPLSKR